MRILYSSTVDSGESAGIAYGLAGAVAVLEESVHSRFMHVLHTSNDPGYTVLTIREVLLDAPHDRIRGSSPGFLPCAHRSIRRRSTVMMCMLMMGIFAADVVSVAKSSRFA